MLLHVPIAATTSLETPATPKVNWAKALRSDQLLAYQRQVSSIVNPLLGKSYSSPVELNVEICSVSQQLCSAALRSLPQCTAFERKKKRYKDQTLAQLALRKKAAWDEWAANGRPDVGPLHDAKTKTRANFRKRMRICIATDERKRTLRFDQQFKGKSLLNYLPRSANKATPF